MQIIDETPNIGALLGRGLSGGINDLVQHKLELMSAKTKRASTAKGLEALGIPQNEALSIAALPDQLQGLVVKNYLSSGEREGFDQALSALRGEQAPQQQQQQPGMEQFYQQAAPQQSGLQAIQNLIASRGVQNPFGQQVAAQQLQPLQQQQLQQGQQAQPQQQKARSFADILRSPRLSPEQRLKLETMAQAKQFHKEKLSAKEQEVVSKETLPFYTETTKGAKAAHNSDKRLDRMEKLINEGNLNGPAKVGLLNGIEGISSSIGSLIGLLWGGGATGALAGGAGGKAVGSGLGGLSAVFLSPESQEFNKLSNDFLKDAKDTFGSRLTDYDVKSFMATVPTLSQSDEGKRRVITNLRSFNKAAILRKKAMDKIVKENGGRRPANLDVLVEESISPQLDALAAKFKEGIS